MRLSTIALASLAAVPALADQNIRILPDQAVLACQARTMHELETRGGGKAKPIERFKTERMENFMFRVKGAFAADLAGETRRVDVECDVSSARVEVFTMIIDDMTN